MQYHLWFIVETWCIFVFCGWEILRWPKHFLGLVLLCHLQSVFSSLLILILLQRWNYLGRGTRYNGYLVVKALYGFSGETAHKIWITIMRSHFGDLKKRRILYTIRILKFLNWLWVVNDVSCFRVSMLIIIWSENG